MNVWSRRVEGRNLTEQNEAPKVTVMCSITDTQTTKRLKLKIQRKFNEVKTLKTTKFFAIFIIWSLKKKNFLENETMSRLIKLHWGEDVILMLMKINFLSFLCLFYEHLQSFTSLSWTSCRLKNEIMLCCVERRWKKKKKKKIRRHKKCENKWNEMPFSWFSI